MNKHRKYCKVEVNETSLTKSRIDNLLDWFLLAKYTTSREKKILTSCKNKNILSDKDNGNKTLLPLSMLPTAVTKNLAIS